MLAFASVGGYLFKEMFVVKSAVLRSLELAEGYRNLWRFGGPI